LVLKLLGGWVDPDCGGFGWRFGCLVDEAVWIFAEGLFEGFLSHEVKRVGLSIMDGIAASPTPPCA
jgi:hypothetical protein